MKLTSLARHAVALALFALGGCTMVLGIHKAERDDAVSMTGGAGSSSGAAGSGSVAPPRPRGCEPVAKGCSACLMANCPGEVTACLGDEPHCGPALDAYARCLGSDCMDDVNGRPDPDVSCAEGLAMSASSGLAQCIKDCGPACTFRDPLSNCDLYCGCMQSECSVDRDRMKDPASEFNVTLGGTIETCLQQCNAVTEPKAKCQRVHCEFAQYDLNHCKHASGVSPNAPS